MRWIREVNASFPPVVPSFIVPVNLKRPRAPRSAAGRRTDRGDQADGIAIASSGAPIVRSARNIGEPAYRSYVRKAATLSDFLTPHRS